MKMYFNVNTYQISTILVTTRYCILIIMSVMCITDI
jgi:hypothetical protein